MAAANLVHKLIAADRASPKRLCVIGDAMEDVWISGEFAACQDACPCFKEAERRSTPGGAAGAARQSANWNSLAWLVSPLQWSVAYTGRFGDKPWQQVEGSLCFGCHDVPVKKRWLVGDKIVFRSDEYDHPWEDLNVTEWRHLALKAIKEMKFDGVLISDYDKGFLDEATIKAVVEFCNRYGIHVVADPKRYPSLYRGAVLKYNDEYYRKYDNGSHAGGLFSPLPEVRTRGAEEPFVIGNCCERGLSSVPCVNHVGAGDCFAAHLLLGLVHGLSLEEAAEVAHSAGRVYVQHRLGRPPWPHEIAKDYDPLGGKILDTPSSATTLEALRRSIPGRIVFTNGVFRLGTHPGHWQLLHWAKKQGDVLVVGVNGDVSARSIRPAGQAILPLADRAFGVAAHADVDWVVPFPGPTPESLLKHLGADVLVKGGEYEGTEVAGAGLVKEVRFFKEGAFPHHTTDLEGRP